MSYSSLVDVPTSIHWHGMILPNDMDGVAGLTQPAVRNGETYLYSFQDGNDGGTPYAGLIADASGNLYGAATQGGANGGGTVFELAPSNGSWDFSVITSVPGLRSAAR